MSSQKKARGLPGMKEGLLVQMLDCQRVHQAASDEAKKLVDASALAAERLVDATKEAEEIATAAATAAALSTSEEGQPERFDQHCCVLICACASDCHGSLLLSNWCVVIPDIL
jgi:hypothetical protein